jgi:hypothetical protein
MQPTGPIAGLQLQIASPANEETVSGAVQVTGWAAAFDMARYRLEYGPGSGDGPMFTIAEVAAQVVGGPLGVWDTAALPPGPYTLRLTLETFGGNAARAEAHVRVGGGAPTVRVTAPLDGDPAYLNEPLSISVEADGAGAPLAGVEIYADGRRISSQTAPPWGAQWAVVTGTHEIRAVAYTAYGQRAESAPVRVNYAGLKPTPTPTPVPVLWISRPTIYQDVKAGVNEVWVDVQPGSTVRHVDVYVDGFPAGYSDGPGFRANPNWTPTAPPAPTNEPTATMEPYAAATAAAEEATAEAKATRVAVAQATRVARVFATATVRAGATATVAAGAAQAATAAAATASPTLGPPTNTPQPSPTPTFVRYSRLPDPMLGDFIARCMLAPGRHRVVAIGYDEYHREVGRDETWVVVR